MLAGAAERRTQPISSDAESGGLQLHLPGEAWTEEEDTSYHQLRVKMEGFCPDSVQLDDRDILVGLLGFGMKLHDGDHGTVATLLMWVTTDEETAKRYERDENNDLLH